MKSIYHHSALSPQTFWRLGGVAVVASMAIPLTGCGSNQPPPPVNAAPGQMAPQSAPQANTGMSTGTKVKILAGAAAAYFLYKKYQNSKQGQVNAQQNVQYYLSESTGRVYYRDPNKNNQAIFVTPAPNNIPQQRVSEREAAAYQGWKGYDGAATGKGLDSVFSTK